MACANPQSGSWRERENVPAGEEQSARTEADQRERKQRLLTQGRASVTRSIADAVVIKRDNLFFLSERGASVPLDSEHGFEKVLQA